MQCTLQSVNSCVSIIEKLQNIGDFFFCFVPSIKDSGRLEKNVRKLEYMSEVFDTPTTKYWTQVFRGQFSDRSSRPQNVRANFRLFFDSCHVFPPKVFKWETDMDMENTVFENYLEMSHQKWGHKGFARVTKEDLDHFQKITWHLLLKVCKARKCKNFAVFCLFRIFNFDSIIDIFSPQRALNSLLKSFWVTQFHFT